MTQRTMLDGVEYEQVNTVGEVLSIVCIDNRGFLVVGYVDWSENHKDHYVVRDSRCIISWGTTGHIAELCDGPTKTTRLGKVAKSPLKVFKNSISFSYTCIDGEWYE